MLVRGADVVGCVALTSWGLRRAGAHTQEKKSNVLPVFHLDMFDVRPPPHRSSHPPSRHIEAARICLSVCRTIQQGLVVLRRGIVRR